MLQLIVTIQKFLNGTKNLKFVVAFFTAIGILLMSCSTCKEISRRTIRVDRKTIWESSQPELTIRRAGESIRINIQKIVRTKTKERDIEKVMCRRKILERRIIFPSEPRYTYYIETQNGEERIIKKKETIPAANVLVAIIVNEHKEFHKTDSYGRIELNLLKVLKGFNINPNQLRITCSAKVDGQRVSRKLVIPSDETQRLCEPEPKIIHPDLEIIQVEFIEPSGNKALDAEETARIKIILKNRGAGVGQGVRIEVQDKEHIPAVTIPETKVPGMIGPGETKAFELTITAQRDLPDGTLRMEIRALEAHGFDSDPIILTIHTRRFLKPILAIADFGIADYDENAQVEPQEVVEVTARIQNKGQGEAKDVQVQVHLGKNIFFAPESQELFSIGDLRPGQTKDVRFSFLTNKRIPHRGKIPIWLELSEKRANVKESVPLNLVMSVTQPKTIKIVIQPTGEIGTTSEQTDPPLSVDVDQNIPKGRSAGKDDWAVIIGNKNYRKIHTVEFAHRDLGVLKEYLVHTMGFDRKNIIEERNATKGIFDMLFGTEANYKGKLYKRVELGQGNSRVFIYYVGHGASDLKTGDVYFVPVDAEPEYISSVGYSLRLFYSNLKKLRAKEIIVVLDCCFSGRTPKGSIYKKASPVIVRPKDPAMELNNGGVLTSAKGSQTSAWDGEKKHSLFTYFFLKGLRGKADANKDKVITMGEMFIYLKNKVPRRAIHLDQPQQTPDFRGLKDIVLVRFK